MDDNNRFKEILTAQQLWEKPISLQRNEHLVVKGAVNTLTYFVVSGSLRIYVQDETDEHTIRFGYKNSFISVLDSFLKNTPTEFYIQAIKQTELLCVKKESLNMLLAENPEMASFWQRLLESLVVQQLEREVDLLTSSPIERYKRVLKRSPQLFQEIPSKYIASYLRMTPETLSRIKKS